MSIMKSTSGGQKSIKHSSKNVRTYFEDLNYVTTKGIDNDTGPWWIHKTSAAKENPPFYSLDSTSRHDYKPIAGLQNCKPAAHRRQQVKGIVPINDLILESDKPLYLKEKISFEHFHDPRNPEKPQTKKKKQGTFIWKEILPGDNDEATVAKVI